MVENFTRISIYVPQKVQQENPLKRLYAIAQKRDRTLNYMVIQAILDYVEREERKAKKAAK
jgi:predicted transcriptional regulator